MPCSQVNCSHACCVASWKGLNCMWACTQHEAHMRLIREQLPSTIASHMSTVHRINCTCLLRLAPQCCEHSSRDLSVLPAVPSSFRRLALSWLKLCKLLDVPEPVPSDHLPSLTSQNLISFWNRGSSGATTIATLTTIGALF